MTSDPEGRGRGTGRLAPLAWCTFDWANSAFPTVIVTFVFSAYFTRAVATDEVTGTGQWSYAVSLSMLATALAGPVLGAIADTTGRRKPWVLACVAVIVLATALLWFAAPRAADGSLPFAVLWVLVSFGIANFAFETSTIFYNAMLPTIAPRDMIGRLSGWGWGLGYLGGLACLALCLVLLIRPDPPLFGLEREIAEPVRAVALLVAAWVALFSLPFFLLTPDPPAGGLAVSEAVRRGVATFVQTVRQVRAYRPIVIYLIAHMIYTDGLNTLFSVGGIYAAVTFGMDFDELLRFGIALNVTAGLGAFAFGWVDDWVGPKRTVLIALGCLLVLASAILLVTSKAWFWGLALGIGIFLGPTQAASRSLMARLAPPQMLGEMFGLYALAGKATAFLGPAVFGAVTQISGSQRVGLSTILLFLIVGMVLLLQVPEGRAAPVPAVSGGSAANR